MPYWKVLWRMNDDKTRLLSMLALARKAGKVITGGDSCEKAIKDGKAQLVFLASDTSPNTQKKIRDKTTFYKTPLSEIFTKEDLNQIGLENRVTLAVVDENFSKKMTELIKVLEPDL